jgi:hypothetical protein
MLREILETAQVKGIVRMDKTVISMVLAHYVPVQQVVLQEPMLLLILVAQL